MTSKTIQLNPMTSLVSVWLSTEYGWYQCDQCGHKISRSNILEHTQQLSMAITIITITPWPEVRCIQPCLVTGHSYCFNAVSSSREWRVWFRFSYYHTSFTQVFTQMFESLPCIHLPGSPSSSVTISEQFYWIDCLESCALIGHQD